MSESTEKVESATLSYSRQAEPRRDPAALASLVFGITACGLCVAAGVGLMFNMGMMVLFGSCGLLCSMVGIFCTAVSPLEYYESRREPYLGRWMAFTGGILCVLSGVGLIGLVVVAVSIR